MFDNSAIIWGNMFLVIISDEKPLYGVLFDTGHEKVW